MNVRAERDELKNELVQLRSRLNTLETGLRLGGEARGWRAQLISVERELLTERQEHEATKWRRNHLVSQLREAETEGAQLRSKVADLKGELSILRTNVVRQVTTEYERGEVLRQLQQLEREKRKQQKLVESANEQAEEAKRRLADLSLRLQRTRREANHEKSQGQRERARLRETLQNAQFDAEQAQAEAKEARRQLVEEEEALREAEKGRDDAEWAAKLSELRARRAREQADKLKKQLEAVALPVKSRSVDEWSQLSQDARRKASQRERAHLQAFFSSHNWRTCDIADALQSLGLVADLFESRPFFDVYYKNVADIVQQLETDHFGLPFALFLHYDLHLPLPKILSISQSASKRFIAHLDR